MAYVRASTNNPLGRKPWNAILQQGGLGAFFPNAEALGSPSVMVDRDAANPRGWKNKSYAGAPVPRIYYAPDAYRQYTTQRAQGLGAVAVRHGGGVAAPRVTAPIVTAPIAPILSPVVRGRRAISLPAGYHPASTAPNTGVTTTSGASGAPAWNTNWWKNFFGKTPATSQDADGNIYTQQPNGTWTLSSQSGNSVSNAGTPVPAGYPTSQAYVDSAGNTWTYTSSGWQITTAAGTSSAAATVADSSVVPAGYPTNETYTDAAGNVWSYEDGEWQITSSASGSGVGSWLSESTLISSLPNYGTLLIGAGVLWFLTKKR
jgi:hypothetical protein